MSKLLEKYEIIFREKLANKRPDLFEKLKHIEKEDMQRVINIYIGICGAKRGVYRSTIVSSMLNRKTSVLNTNIKSIVFEIASVFSNFNKSRESIYDAAANGYSKDFNEYIKSRYIREHIVVHKDKKKYSSVNFSLLLGIYSGLDNKNDFNQELKKIELGDIDREYIEFVSEQSEVFIAGIRQYVNLMMLDLEAINGSYPFSENGYLCPYAKQENKKENALADISLILSDVPREIKRLLYEKGGEQSNESGKFDFEKGEGLDTYTLNEIKERSDSFQDAFRNRLNREIGIHGHNSYMNKFQVAITNKEKEEIAEIILPIVAKNGRINQKITSLALLRFSSGDKKEVVKAALRDIYMVTRAPLKARQLMKEVLDDAIEDSKLDGYWKLAFFIDALHKDRYISEFENLDSRKIKQNIKEIQINQKRVIERLKKGLTETESLYVDRTIDAVTKEYFSCKGEDFYSKFFIEIAERIGAKYNEIFDLISKRQQARGTQ